MKNKVAYIVSMVNGLEPFIHREIDELRKQNIEIELFITKHTKDPIYGPENSGWRYNTINFSNCIKAVIPVLSTSVISPKIFIKALIHRALLEYFFAAYFSSIIKKRKIKHIHCHFGDSKLFIGYFCRLILGIDLSTTIHSHEIHANKNKDLFIAALKNCSKIFAISEYTKTKLINDFNAPMEKIVINRLFAKENNYKLKNRPLTVLTVSRLDEIKGHKYLLEAAQTLKDRNIKFVIVGEGPLNLKIMIEEKGLTDTVILYNKMDQSQLSFFYQQADIFCLPSIEIPGRGVEGIPVVLMEAMSFGLPVITTSTGGIPELVNNYLIPPEDSSAIAELIRKLANDPTLRAKQGEDNKTIIGNKYSSKNLNALKDLFSKTSK